MPLMLEGSTLTGVAVPPREPATVMPLRVAGGCCGSFSL